MQMQEPYLMVGPVLARHLQVLLHGQASSAAGYRHKLIIAYRLPKRMRCRSSYNMSNGMGGASRVSGIP